MIRPWSQVDSNPEFQRLTSSQKLAAQEQYFNEVVSPKVGDNQEAARQQFFSQYNYSKPDATAALQRLEQEEQRKAASPFAQPPQQLAEEKGLMDLITGSERQTRATEELPELGQGGLLAGEDMATGAKVAPLLAVTTDPQEMADILKSNYPDLGITYDEKGNIAAYNPKNQARVILNKPGASPMDLINTLGLGAAFTAGGPQAGLLKTIGKDAAIEAAIQSAQSAGGGEFNPTDVILAAGGAGVFKGIEHLASTLYRAAKGKISVEQAKQIAESEMRGLKPTTSDIIPPTTAPGRFAQQLGEQTPVFGTSKALEQKQATRQQLAEEFVGEFKPSYDDIIQSLTDKKDMVRAAAVKTRQNVVNQVSGAQIPSSKAVAAIDQEIERLTTLPGGKPRSTVDRQAVDTLERYKADIQADPSFQNMEQLRTDFRTDVRGDDVVVSDRKKGAIKRIYGSMTEDLDDVVRENMTPREFAQWKKSNAVYAREAESLKKSRLKTLFNKGEQVSSEDIKRQILTKDEKVRQNLFRSLNTEGRKNARAALISTFADNASKTGELSVNQFLSQIRKNKGQINDFFKGKDRKALDGLVTALEATKRAQDAPVVTKSGMQAIPYVAGASALANLPATIAGAAGAGTLSRIYESRPVRDALLKLASVPKGSTQFEQALENAVFALTGATQVLRSEATE